MSSADSTKKISRFELLEQLGEGGIGIVYKAMDPLLQKVVAIKVLNAGQLSDDQQVRFQNEARTLAELKHQSIPEIFNFAISEEGAPYIVMEFAQGKSLSSLLEQKTFLPVETAVDITAQTCSALEYANSANILHRDIKPANIIISDDGEVKIVDFGLAKFEKDINASQFQTKAGLVIGSPLYMSPERFRSAKIDVRSDIYSLGCVLFEMLSGDPPYAGETPMETANMHLDSAVPQLPDRVQCTPIVRTNLQSVLNRCLAKKPEERFKSMRDFESALDSVLQNENEPIVSAESTAQKKRSLITWAAVSLALLVLVVGGSSLIVTVLPDPNKDKPLPKAVQSMSAPDVINMLSGDVPWLVTAHSAKSSSDVTDEDFKKLAANERIGDIRAITVEVSTITGTGMKYLKGRNIKTIKINSPYLSDQALDFLPPTVKDLQLGRAEKLTLNSYKKIAQTKIESLKLLNMRIPDGALLELSKLPTLKYLYLRNEFPKKYPIDPKPIGMMRNLELLEINGYDFTNKDLPILTGMKRLFALTLEHLDFDDSNLELLKSFPYLQEFRLKNTKITSAGLKTLEQLKSLKLVDISKCPNISKAEALAFKIKHKKGSARPLTVVIDGDEQRNLSGEELAKNYIEKSQ